MKWKGSPKARLPLVGVKRDERKQKKKPPNRSKRNRNDRGYAAPIEYNGQKGDGVRRYRRSLCVWDDEKDEKDEHLPI